MEDAGTADASTRQTGDAGVVAPDAGPRVPVFQKTACIDPSAIMPDVDHDFVCKGIEFWVTVPKQCSSRACGLILNIHGATMTDHATMEQATNMIAVASKQDFIVVHPHAMSGTWDIPNDKESIFATLQELISAFDVDTTRVHSTGYSQGGQISWALGCEHADVLASIAPAEEINRQSDCWKTDKRPARELSVLFTFGRQDSIAGGFDAAQMQVDQYVAAGMLSGPVDIGGTAGGNWQRQRWTSASGHVLEFLAHNYTNPLIAGHCLVNPQAMTYVNCSAPLDYNWADEVVTFFVAHPAQ